MKVKKPISYNNIACGDCQLEYNTINTCPSCKAKIAPVYIASVLNDAYSASILDLCSNCNNAILTKYSVSCVDSAGGRKHYVAQSILYSEPNRYEEQKFDDKIEELSPQFVKIYNQAYAAETYGLDEMAGLGYRKALEFLVKDFSIYERPDIAEEIKVKPLMQCIKNYIDNASIVTLAERSAWIGNDEAHYVRKQENRDVNDMKAFIQAIVYFIGMILITEDAASMTPK